jgi:CHAT domain-containing protein
VVEALHNIAVLHADLGLHRTAVQHLNRCIELNSAAAHPRRLLTDKRALARSLASLGDIDGAREALDEALRHCAVELAPDDDRTTPLAWHDEDGCYLITRYDDAWRVLQQRARLVTPKDVGGAIADLEWAVQVVERLRERVLSEERRIGTQDEMMEIYDDLIVLHADRFAATGEQASAKAAFLNIERAKSRVLAEMLSEQKLPAPRDAPPELIDREESLLKEAARLEKAIELAEEDPLAASDNLDKVLDELNDIWDMIAKQVPNGGPEYVALRRAEPIDADDIVALLREAGGQICLVNYYVLPDRFLLVVLDSAEGDLSIVQQPVGRKKLRDWVAVNPDNPPPPDRRLQYWSLDFGPLLIEPLENLVPHGAGICFAPHDALHALPLHALEPKPKAQPLVQSTAVSYTPSASLLRFFLSRPASQSREFLVLGCPDRDDAARIEHTRSEAIAVAEVLGCEPRLGADVTCSAATEHMPKSRIVHIACHHIFDSDAPMHSALLLSDGDLTAQRLLEVPISADLVTLSACQSGVSRLRPGDELMGTVRALIYSGARSVVVSLWNAYDQETASLMSDFYRQFVNGGSRKRDALRIAQLNLRSQKSTKAHWAPFVLIGDWR